MPKVSVIMGVYNVKKQEMAEQALQSVLKQTFKDFELIICDDGSDNKTADIIKQIISHDKRVKIIQNDRNRGLAYSLNHCLQYATGEYIARMDIDDISYPDRFEKQIEFMDSHPEYAFCGTWADLFEGDNIWGTRKRPEFPQKEDFLFGPKVIHATIFIRKDVLDAVNGYCVRWDTARAEDYELFMRLYSLNYKAYNIQKALYQIREDKDAYKRRTYKYRIQEAHVRMTGFKQLKLYPKAIIYVVKPLIVGLIPQIILKKLRREEV